MTTDEAPLVEAVVGAYRERGSDGAVRGHPAFFDLDQAGRREAFEATLAARALERALHPLGRSSTVTAVLGRLLAHRP
jgi:hypothetical protein